MKRASRAAAPLVLGAALLAGCGRAPAPDAPAGDAVSRALALRPPPDTPRPRTRVVRALAVPTTPAEWDVQAPRARLGPAEPGGGGPRALVLLGEGEKRVRIPGAFSPREVRRVRLRFLLEGDDHLAVWLLRGGEVAVRSRSLRVHGTGGAQALDLEPELDPDDDTGFDGLMVHVYGVAPRFALTGIELLDVPPAARLPDARDGPAAVRIGHEERLGVGLAAGRPLLGAFTAREGEELAFSFGRPPFAPGAGEPAAVRLVLGGEETASYRLELPPDGWGHARVPLDDVADGPAEARFELEGAADAVVALGEPRVLRPELDAPVVLLVTSDTHRGDHLGAAESGVEVATPALDALAARGVLFTDCFSSANYTIPSHSALFTGLTPRDTRVVDNYGRLAERAETLAERFREAGWLTVASVSARLLRSGGLGQGFQRFAVPDDPDWHAADAVARLEEWLDDARGRPTFAWLHLYDAHRPYQPPPPFDRKYWSPGLDPADPTFEPDLPLEFLEANAPGLRRVEFFEAQYRAEVDYVDAQLVRLLALPRLRDAVVAVTADHGESLGGHGIWWTHEGLYPDTLHVPLILAWPGGPRGTRVDAPVRQIDLAPTLLELAGLPSGGFPGTSLLRTVEGAAPAGPRFALANDAFSAAITAGGWHLILNLRDHWPEGVLERRERHAVELYDLAADPRCERELAAAEPERAARLRERLVEWLTAPPADDLSATAELDRETRDEIAALGYAESSDRADGAALLDSDCDCAECARWR